MMSFVKKMFCLCSSAGQSSDSQVSGGRPWVKRDPWPSAQLVHASQLLQSGVRDWIWNERWWQGSPSLTLKPILELLNESVLLTSFFFLVVDWELVLYSDTKEDQQAEGSLQGLAGALSLESVDCMAKCKPLIFYLILICWFCHFISVFLWFIL